MDNHYLESLNENGYCIIPNMLNPDEIFIDNFSIL